MHTYTCERGKQYDLPTYPRELNYVSIGYSGGMGPLYFAISVDRVCDNQTLMCQFFVTKSVLDSGNALKTLYGEQMEPPIHLMSPSSGVGVSFGTLRGQMVTDVGLNAYTGKFANRGLDIGPIGVQSFSSLDVDGNDTKDVYGSGMSFGKSVGLPIGGHAIDTNSVAIGDPFKAYRTHP